MFAVLLKLCCLLSGLSPTLKALILLFWWVCAQHGAYHMFIFVTTWYACEIETPALAHGWGILPHCVPKIPPGQQ